MGKKISAVLDSIPQAGRYILVLVVIAIISFLFPNKVQFKYHYQQGQTWGYGDLEAPFDFPILKPEEEINSEIKKLNENFKPYYKLEVGVADSSKARMEKFLEEALKRPGLDSMVISEQKKGKAYSKLGESLIDKIYAKGVIQPYSEHLSKDEDFDLNLIFRNTIENRRFQSFFTKRTATSILMDSISKSDLQAFPVFTQALFESIVPNVIYSDSITKALYEEALRSEITYSRGMVPKGTVIITRSGIVTDKVYQQLRSLETEYINRVTKDKNAWLIFIGYLLLTSLIIGSFVFFLRIHEPKIFQSFRQLSFMLLWFIVYSYLVFILVKTEALNLYIIPFCIVPIVIKSFYNSRIALFTHILIILIASFLSPLGYEFAFVQIMAGIVAVLVNFKTRYITSFFLSIFYIWISYNLTYFCLSVIKSGNLNSLELAVHGWISLNVFLTLLSYPLIPLMERIFGYTSEITLVEFSDLDKPLLRSLGLKAPGTLQHSLQVGNIAEAAANAIGANALLVKVGALYHDVGKIRFPQLFIENQEGKNPHEDFTIMESVNKIIEHVPEGAKMGRKAGLPKVLIDFIMTHHGTTRVEFFYRRYLDDNPDGKDKESLFRYPGPKPRTKEETILMIADSLEASSKALQDKTEASIDELTEKIIAGKIKEHQFEDSQLSFEELNICKESFKKTLKSIYHVRIAYPEEEKDQMEK